MNPISERPPGNGEVVLESVAGALDLAAHALRWDPLWDIARGSEWRKLSGHVTSVLCCSFSPDGRLVASGDNDTVRVWIAGTGVEVASAPGHVWGIRSCCFTPDGRLLVTASTVSSCAVSSDGQWIVSVSTDRTLRVWALDTGASLAVLPLPGRLVGLAIHPSRPLAAHGDEVGVVQFVDLIGLNYGPLIVTAVDLGEGLEIRCPHCNRMIPWQEKYRGKETACPLTGPDCGGPLKVNPFVVGEQA